MSGLAVAAEGASSLIGRTFGSRSALSLFGIWSATNFLTASAETANSLAEGAHIRDPNTFERSGYAAGAAVGGLGMLVADGAWLAHGWNRAGGLDAINYNGQSFQRANGGFNILKEYDSTAKGWKTGGFVSETGALGKNIEANGARGVYTKGSKFSANLGWKANAGLMALAVGGSVIMPKVLGFAGKFIDEAHNEQRKMQEINYDTRFFNTDKYDANTYQQLGAAMNNYQNKMVSMARVFHSR